MLKTVIPDKNTTYVDHEQAELYHVADHNREKNFKTFAGEMIVIMLE